MHVAITGSTGLVGERLTQHLREQGHQVTRLVRHPTDAEDEAHWDTDTGALDAERLRGVDGLVHLAGEPIGQRWTKARKERILASRGKGTRRLVEAFAALEPRPRVLVSASAIGIYGHQHGDEWLDEKSTHGDDFLAEVCQRWEAATAPARASGIRVVNTRFGLVQSPDGLPLAQMLPIFKAGLGGRLGKGDAWWSWVALTDVVRAITFALEHDDVVGAYNVTAPEPVTNAAYTKVLGEVLGRPTVFPVPRFALKLVFGEMAEVAILASQRVSSQRLRSEGFTFEHPELAGALRAELGK